MLQLMIIVSIIKAQFFVDLKWTRRLCINYITEMTEPKSLKLTQIKLIRITYTKS